MWTISLKCEYFPSWYLLWNANDSFIFLLAHCVSLTGLTSWFSVSLALCAALCVWACMFCQSLTPLSWPVTVAVLRSLSPHVTDDGLICYRAWTLLFMTSLNWIRFYVYYHYQYTSLKKIEEVHNCHSLFAVVSQLLFYIYWCSFCLFMPVLAVSEKKLARF